MIRRAQPMDMDRVLDMAARFFKSSVAAKWFSFDREATRATVARLIDSPDALVLVAEKGNDLAGMAMVLSYPCWFSSSHNTAQELLWWVEPERRSSRHGLEMHKRIEEWARAKGCQTVEMIALDGNNAERLARYYIRCGYSAKEHTYCKRIC